MYIRSKFFRLLLLPCASALAAAFTNNGASSSFQSSPKLLLLRQETRLSVTGGKDNKGKRKLTPAQRILQKQKEDEKPSKFDETKSLFYASFDNLQKGIKSNVQKDSTTNKVRGGYQDRLKNKPKLPKKAPKPTAATAATTTTTTTGTSKVLDSMKDAIYGTVDRATESLRKPKQEKQPTPPPIVETLPVASSESSTSPEGSYLSPSALKALEPELQSDNPFKRFAGEIKLKDLERKEMARVKKLEAQEKIRQIKETAYTISDNIQTTGKQIQAIPGQVKDFTDKTVDVVQSIPDKTQQAVETVASIPDKVQKKANEVQESVDTTIANTKQAIEDVKAIPDKVQKRAVETKQSIDSAMEAVNDATTSTKVLLGLEKAKPKPPKVPPPKKTEDPSALDFGVAVGTAVVSGAGKTLFWVGKNLATAVFQPKKDEKKKKDAAKSSLDNTTTTSATIPKPPPKQAPKPPRKKIHDPELDRQVQEALRLAADALDDDDDDIEKKKKGTKA